VAQHDTFGFPGGAGGVNNRCQLLFIYGGGTVPESPFGAAVFAGRKRFELEDAVRLIPFDLDEVAKARALSPYLDQLRHLGRVLYDRHSGTRIVDLIGKLGCGERQVHGDVGRPQIQHREIHHVHHVPLGTIVREQQNAVARRHTKLDERIRQRAGFGEEVLS